ncbi:N-acetylneuraminate synthase family protein [Chloroflexota bacterium]
MRNIILKDRALGDGQPTFIVAEMAWSHDGSIEKAKRIIRGAAEAEADAINFHITSVEDYMVPQYGGGRGTITAGKDVQSIYDHLRQINLSPEAWKQLFAYAREQHLLVITMCNDLPSVELASQLEPDMYGIHSACLAEEGLVTAVASKQKPVSLKVGAMYLGETERAVRLIEQAGNHDIVLMHGIQNYPTKLEDMHLKYIEPLKQIFGLPVGFADHTDGGSALALIIPAVAVAFGANVIEKHITHDRSLKGVDSESALDPEGLRKLVKNLRQIEKAFGSPTVRPISGAEADYRQSSKKRTVARNTLEKGERITRDKIAFKRSEDGVYPDESQFLIGRTVNTRIEKDEPVTWDRIS